MAESIGDISDIDVAMEATAKNYELSRKIRCKRWARFSRYCCKHRNAWIKYIIVRAK